MNLWIILLVLLALGAFGGGYAGWYSHGYGFGGGGFLILVLIIILVARG